MRLKEFIEWKKTKPYLWADEVGLPRSMVYAWIAGTKPSLKYLLMIQRLTEGNVKPEDFNGTP